MAWCGNPAGQHILCFMNVATLRKKPGNRRPCRPRKAETLTVPADLVGGETPIASESTSGVSGSYSKVRLQCVVRSTHAHIDVFDAKASGAHTYPVEAEALLQRYKTYT